MNAILKPGWSCKGKQMYNLQATVAKTLNWGIVSGKVKCHQREQNHKVKESQLSMPSTKLNIC